MAAPADDVTDQRTMFASREFPSWRCQIPTLVEARMPSHQVMTSQNKEGG
jgi:hypothetical protein